MLLILVNSENRTTVYNRYLILKYNYSGCGDEEADLPARGPRLGRDLRGGGPGGQQAGPGEQVHAYRHQGSAGRRRGSGGDAGRRRSAPARVSGDAHLLQGKVLCALI